jgi:hypothetical protein
MLTTGIKMHLVGQEAGNTAVRSPPQRGGLDRRKVTALVFWPRRRLKHLIVSGTALIIVVLCMELAA